MVRPKRLSEGEKFLVGALVDEAALHDVVDAQLVAADLHGHDVVEDAALHLLELGIKMGHHPVGNTNQFVRAVPERHNGFVVIATIPHNLLYLKG